MGRGLGGQLGFSPSVTGGGTPPDMSGFVRAEHVLTATSDDFGMDTAADAATNTTAFDDCAAALEALGGGWLLIGPGTYEVNTLDVPSGVIVMGAGVGVTVLDGQQALAPVLNFEGTYSALSSSGHVRNAGFHGLSITGTGTSIGVNFQHASSLHIGDFRVDDVAYGIRGYDWWDSVISGDARIQQCTVGVWFGSHNNDTDIGGVVDTNNIRFTGAFTIESCYQSDIVVTGKGADGTGTGSQKPNNIWFDKLKVESVFVQDARRVILESVNGVYFTQPLFAWNGYDTGYSTPVDGVYVTGESLHVAVISPNFTNTSTNVIASWVYANGTDWFTLRDPSFLLNQAPATAHLRFGGTNRRADYDLDGVKLSPSFAPAALTISGTPTSTRQTYLRADGQVALTSDLVLSDGSPAASEAYVDAAASGLTWKEAVRTTSTTPVTLSALSDGDTVGGAVVWEGQRVALIGQTAAAEGGIYQINNTSEWTAVHNNGVTTTGGTYQEERTYDTAGNEWHDDNDPNKGGSFYGSAGALTWAVIADPTPRASGNVLSLKTNDTDNDIRAFRWKELRENQEAVISVDCYFPEQPGPLEGDAFFNLFQVKSRNSNTGSGGTTTGTTTLAEALDASETGVDVTTRSNFPSSGSFEILVDSERMIVTAGAGTGAGTLTVVRGAHGTTAATHSNGATVTWTQRNDPIWALYGRNDGAGGLKLEVGYGWGTTVLPGPWNNSTNLGGADPYGRWYKPGSYSSNSLDSYGSQTGADLTLPIGEWFTVRMQISQMSAQTTGSAYTGRVRIWIDDTLYWTFDNVITSYWTNIYGNAWNGDGEWAVCNYHDGTALTDCYVYFDNAEIKVPAAATRVTDMNQGAEFPGAAFLTVAGTNGGNAYVCTNTSNPTVDTTAITFSQFSGGTSTLAGDVTGSIGANTITSIGGTVVTGGGAGGTITVTGKLSQTLDPVDPGDLATKDYVDTQVSPTNIYKRYADYENGDDANDGLTPASAKQTVRAAVLSLPDSTTGGHDAGIVECAPCQFTETTLPIPITRNIAIIGAPSAGGQGITSNYDKPGTTIKAGDGTNANIFDSGNYDDGTDYTDWSHRVVLRDLMIDGNRANNPGGGYGIVFRQPGFQQDLNNVTIKECNKAGLFVKERGVNFHTRNLGVTHCGAQHPGVSLSGGTFTFPNSQVHGAEVGDVIVFHDGAWSGGSGPTDWLPYYVKTVPTTTTMTIASVKGGSSLAFTGVTGTATAMWPGGIRIEIEDSANGCLYTLRDLQCDDNGYSNVHVDVAAVGSKNHKISIDGMKVENKVGTVNRITSGESASSIDYEVYIKSDHTNNRFQAYSDQACTTAAALPSGSFTSGYALVIHDVVDSGTAWSAGGLTGLKPWTRYYIRDRSTGSNGGTPGEFKLALTKGGTEIDFGVLVANCRVKFQLMGGSARCHNDAVTVDQRDAAHGITVNVRNYTWQTDGGIRDGEVWAARQHSIVRLIGTPGQGITTETVVNIEDANAAFSGAYFVDDYDTNTVRAGDPFTWRKYWYHGVPTGANPLGMMIGQAGIMTGTNSPQGVVVANIGTLYLCTNGSTNTTLYVKTANNGLNTGWTAK